MSKSLSTAKLRTLELLGIRPAIRRHRTNRPGDYSWFHENADGRSITPTLHSLFVMGLADIAEDDRDVAVITQRGREILRARQPAPARPGTVPSLESLAA